MTQVGMGDAGRYPDALGDLAERAREGAQVFGVVALADPGRPEAHPLGGPGLPDPRGGVVGRPGKHVGPQPAAPHRRHANPLPRLVLSIMENIALMERWSSSGLAVKRPARPAPGHRNVVMLPTGSVVWSR